MGFLDDYEPVEDRLRAFWSEHHKGRISTQLVHHGTAPGDVLIVRAECYRDEADERPAASGYAHQRLLPEPPLDRKGKPNESAPEWTSPWEVAETSAIGRALANLGYAAKGKRPSREEVSKATASGASSRAGNSQPQGSGAPEEPSDAVAAAEEPSTPAEPEAAHAKGSAGCAHLHTTEFKPDRVTPLPEGRVRCIDCGLLLVIVP